MKNPQRAFRAAVLAARTLLGPGVQGPSGQCPDNAGSSC
jgi:hypothetical protein